MQHEMYFYKKDVDWSALNLGINIPVNMQDTFYQDTNLSLKKGDNKKILLVIDGITYQATITNINFNESKYPGHKELLQIRYTQNSAIAKRLQEIFHFSFTYLSNQKSLLDNKRKPVSVPINDREYIAIYTTDSPDVLIFDCITNDEISETLRLVKDKNEMQVEGLLAMKDDASVFTRERTIKIRKLDKSISDRLKQIYKYQCQICGLAIGKKYGATIIHSHHIDYFSTSLNNNADNILIVCPNHHSIIHSVNPVFDRTANQYIYPNGLIEGLNLNYHL